MYVRAKIPEVVYHLTKKENVEKILEDGKIKLFGDTECWFCESIPNMKRYMEYTVMNEGKPYIATGGAVKLYPKFKPEEYAVLKLTPKYREGKWYRWMQEMPPNTSKEMLEKAREFSNLKIGFRGELRFSNCEIIEIGEVLMNKNEHETLIGIAGEKTKTLKSVEDVAKFICEEGKRGDVQITREDGTPFLDTFGIYINRIADMEYRARLLEVLIPMQKRLDGTPMTVKEQYPTGTRIELIKMGEDPQPVPPGTRGTVDYVDDADQIHMKWDNGRTLALVIGEDEFRTLDQDEINEERCKKFIEGVNKNVLSSFDMGKMIEAYTDKDMSYPTEILKGMHNEFLKVYGTDEVNRDMGFVTVPAVVKVPDGSLYAALVDLDLESSGEHWGTQFITPIGVVDQSGDYKSEYAKSFVKSLIPYDYWYTVKYDDDIHISMDDCPEDVHEMITNATDEGIGGIKF